MNKLKEKKNKSALNKLKSFDEFKSATFSQYSVTHYNIKRVIPSLITLSALCSGFTAFRFSLVSQWDFSVLCIIIACILDAADGRVARYLGYSSSFGAELDSLSDLICFGVAPSIVLYFFSMHNLNNTGWGVCLFYVVCCAIRLAKFNTDLSDSTNAQASGLYFIGVPSPIGAMIALFPIVLFLQSGCDIFCNAYLCAIYMISSGLLMVSKIPTFATKKLKISKNKVPFILVLCSGIIILCFIMPWLFLSVFILCYLISIPLSYRFFKTNKVADIVV